MPSSKAFIGYRRYDENNLEIQSSGYLQLWAPWTPLTTSWPNSGGLDCIVMDGYTESWHENDCYEDVSAVCSPPFRLSQATTAIPTTNTTSTSTTSTSITTSTVPSTSTTSQVDDTLSSVQDCHCQCNSSSEAIIIYPITNITDELQAKLDNLKTETMVDEETLSATLRKRTSASDSRPSSAYVGYLGIALLSIILGGILLLDLPRLILFIKR
ncbi:uncharacterized protein LOC132545230 [Ylistrum balloti]|uniref:uncharacterized protein LOC132545230 n=1 Tax=Ylistrum balloti TaxID=509963 RepID=UPI002905D3D9|nr:uncharacterized protein LOC132545230 [Ylistrum balloti]